MGLLSKIFSSKSSKTPSFVEMTLPNGQRIMHERGKPPTQQQMQDIMDGKRKRKGRIYYPGPGLTPGVDPRVHLPPAQNPYVDPNAPQDSAQAQIGNMQHLNPRVNQVLQLVSAQAQAGSSAGGFAAPALQNMPLQQAFANADNGTRLGGSHREINGYPTDAPQFFMRKNGGGGAGLPNLDPNGAGRVSRRSTQRAGRNGLRPMRGNQQDPLAGFGQQNWAAPRGNARAGQLGSETGYPDDATSRKGGRSHR
ncbi:hypothetical protein N0V90_001612 [Kalmusia sp. IMI 367209]|nr:hypothetical protein N0V90_001612 [Kalmusia sp. IMI 367209]